MTNDSKTASARKLSIQQFLAERFAAEEAAWHLGMNMVTQPAFAKLCRSALDDLAAKRAILDHMKRREERTQFTTSDLTILCILAAPYSEHPEYRPGWAP